MNTLLLKLVLTPALIGLASLAGRRWGPSVSGWLVGLPFTSGPIILFLVLDHGTGFGARAALGVAAGTMSQAAFALTYSRLARGFGMMGSLLAAGLAFGVATALLLAVSPATVILAVVVAAVLLVALAAMPDHVPGADSSARSIPVWDIPARMVVAVVFVLLLTGAAPLLGPRLAGLLTPFPLYATVLTVFAHRLYGAGAAIGVLDGLLFGLFSFAAFFITLAGLLQRIGIGAAFAAALIVALGLQMCTLAVLRARPVHS